MFWLRSRAPNIIRLKMDHSGWNSNAINVHPYIQMLAFLKSRTLLFSIYTTLLNPFFLRKKRN